MSQSEDKKTMVKTEKCLKPRFYSQATYKPPKGELMTTVSETEQHGYIPAPLQISRILEAGQRLDDYRKFVYDFDDMEKIDINDIEPDPTRDTSFDMADASILAMKLQIKKKEAEYNQKLYEEQKQKQEAKSVQKEAEPIKETPEAESKDDKKIDKK